MLSVKTLDQARHGFVVCNLQQPAVEAGIPLRDPEQVALGQARLHLADNRAQVGDIGIGDIPRRVACRQTVENSPRLKRLDSLLLRDRPHARAAVWLALDEAILLKARQGGAYGRPADVVLMGQVHFNQALVRLKLAAEDRLVQALVALVGLGAALGRYAHGHPRINGVGLSVYTATHDYRFLLNGSR
jgi:hypothetical protein